MKKINQVGASESKGVKINIGLSLIDNDNPT